MLMTGIDMREQYAICSIEKVEISFPFTITWQDSNKILKYRFGLDRRYKWVLHPIFLPYPPLLEYYPQTCTP